MSTGTITPTPFQTVEGFDADGLWGPIAGCLIYTYDAGTMDPATTYTNVGLTVANSNPIEADSSGRWSAFLSPGHSYKFYYCLPVTPIPVPSSPPSAFRTADNIAATPLSSLSVDINGVLGENVAAGNALYLSDGSGGKTQGRWYLASTANPYSSTSPEIGFAVTAGSTGDTILIRQAGQVADQSGLSVGSLYYLSTAGGVTTTPSSLTRFVGQADTTTTLIVSPNPPIPNTDNGVNDFRLSLTTGVPVTTDDVTAATTLYCTPYRGNRIALFNSVGGATVATSAQFSIAVPATTATNYDVFAYASSGVPTLELVAWRNNGQAITGASNATPIVITANGHGLLNGDQVYINGVKGTTAANGTWIVANVATNTYELVGSVGNGVYTAATGYFNARASTALLVLTTTGTYTKTADLTRRYLGSFRTTGVSGQTADSFANRYLWNYYNRIKRLGRVLAATDTWSYTTATYRQADAGNVATANQLTWIVGVQEENLRVEVIAGATNSANAAAQVSIGLDSATATATGVMGQAAQTFAAGPVAALMVATFDVYLVPGFHFLTWLERSTASGATTWYGDNGDSTLIQSGIVGWLNG